MNEIELSVIRSDYYSALGDYGIKHIDAIEQTLNRSDFIETEIENISVKRSEIEGQGVFADIKFKKHALICIARLGNERTIAGRYTNHSPDCNATFMFAGNNIGLVAIKDIQNGEEITVNYRDSLSLQIQKPENIDNLVVSNKDISTVVTGRCFMAGVDAAAYDLLFSDDHIDNLSVRERVLAFENALSILPQVHIEPKHEFIDG